MSFLIYFFVLLVSAASVLFGLDLMTSPLPRTPNVPIGRSVQVATAPVQQARRKEADARALTPVRPAAPAAPPAPTVQVQTSGAAPQDEAKLTPAPQVPPPASQPATAEPKAAEVNEAKTEPASAPQPAAQQQAVNSCNVQACGAAYHSFRASDCTYQTFGGERRACAIASGAVTAAAAPPRAAKPAQQREAAGGRDELRDVERIVKRQPLSLQPPPQQRARASRDEPRANRDEMSEVERIVRHMTRNETGDIPVQDADGRLFIVRKVYR